MKGKLVNEVKEKQSLVFTRNLLSLCNLPLWVKE